MARLKNPTTGTVVDVEGDLADRYRATGWEEDKPEKPKRTRRTKSADDEE